MPSPNTASQGTDSLAFSCGPVRAPIWTRKLQKHTHNGDLEGRVLPASLNHPKPRVKWYNAKIDAAVPYKKLFLAVPPSHGQNGSQAEHTHGLSICPCANIVLSLTQDIYRSVVSSLTSNVVGQNQAIPLSFPRVCSPHWAPSVTLGPVSVHLSLRDE